MRTSLPLKWCLGAALLLAAPLAAQAQTTPGVGIGTTAPDASAALDIVSSTKGVLLPRVATAAAIASPAPGLLVYQTSSPAGFYYNAGTTAVPSWQQLATAGSGTGDNLGNHIATQPLNLQGNALTGTGSSLSGVGLGVRADGGLNLGQNALGHNLLLGYQAGQSLAVNAADSSGFVNQLVGYQAGASTTTGNRNQLGGYQAGYANTTGSGNYVQGYRAGYRNTTGNANHFVGYEAGYRNTTGEGNQFEGFRSGQYNTTGYANVFSGALSGAANTTGYYNQYLGYNAGANSTTGTQNLFVGYASGIFNATGSNNTALGANSGPDSSHPGLSNATAVGANVPLAQDNTVVLGNGARVGIGTNTPATTLDVRGDAGAAITVGSTSDGNGALYFANGNHGVKRDYNGNGNSVGVFTTAGDLYLSANGPGTADNFVLQNGGNVGIGTSGPSQKLDVAGGLRARSLSGTGTHVVSALPDGTLTTNSGIYGASPYTPGTLAGAIGSAGTDSGPCAVAVVGSRAYVANRNSLTLQIFDLSAPTPALLGGVAVENNGGPTLDDVAVSGTIAYVAEYFGAKLVAVNISNPAAPVVVGRLFMPSAAYRVAVSGTKAYVTTTQSFSIVDISNPAAMTLLSSTTVDPNASLTGIAVSGNRAYMLDNHAHALLVYDVSNASSPSALGTVGTNLFPYDVALNGSMAYVVSWGQNTLQTIDISNPAAMSVVNIVGTGSRPFRLALSGTKAYVPGHDDNSLRIYDLTVPSAPALQTTLTTDSQPTAVAANGGMAYVTNEGSNTLQVFGYLPPRTVAVNADGTLASVPASSTAAGPGLSSTTSGSTTTIQLGGSALTAATDVPLGGNNLTFSGAGNVGIGPAATPTAPLDVNGAARVRSLTATGTRMVTADASGNLGSATLPTDAQQLSVGGGNLSISGGNSVTLTSLGDNLGNHTAIQKLDLASYSLVGNGGSAGLSITSGGNVGIGTTATQALDVNGGILARGSSLIGNQGAHLQWNRSGGAGETLLLNQQGGGGGGIVFGKSDSKTTGMNTVTEWARFNGNGHLLLGSSIANTTATGASQAVEFVGPGFNTDPVGLYRTNPGSDQSELRVVVGDAADANDKFAVGRTNVTTEGTLTGGTFTPNFTVQADGNVGIGTGSPGQKLDVNGTTQTTNAIVTTALTGSGADVGTAVAVGVRADGGLNLGQAALGHNVLLGYQAGKSLVPNEAFPSGIFSTFVGYQAGQATTSGYLNTFTGYQSGYTNTTGHRNTFGGYQSGYAHQSGSDNVFQGFRSGYNSTTGGSNAFYGASSGYNTTTGGGNTFVGAGSGNTNQSGNSNVFVGTAAGQYNVSGSTNTALGSGAGPVSGSGALTNTTAVGAGTQTTQSNTVVLGSGANVGIGTSEPSQKLDVRGNLRLGDNNAGTAGIGTGQAIEWVGPGLNTDPVGLYRVNPASDQSELRVVVGDAADANDKFVVGRTSAGGEGGIPGGTFTPNFTVRADGNVGIGTSSPAAALQVNGTALVGSGTPPNTVNATGIGWNAVNVGVGESEFYNYRGSGSGGFRFFVVGGTGAPTSSSYVGFINPSTGAYSSISDRRAKTNIAAVGYGLRAVLALRPVAYDLHPGRQLKDGVVTFLPTDRPVRSLGFVAQDLLQVVPEAVEKPADERKEFYTVSYATLVPVLTQAIQEQQAQIEALKAENAALRTQAATDKAQATATLETFEARLRRLEVQGEGQARK